MKIVTFFNNKGGVGKTSLVYHLSWAYALLGVRVLAVDLDPQANLTSMFLEDEPLEALWPQGEHPRTVLGILRPIIRGLGDIESPHPTQLQPAISLLPGDLGLSTFEDKLSANWPLCNDRDESAFRVTSSFYRMITQAAEKARPGVVLVDVGPNLGAINRAVLIATDHIIIPLAPDLFSMQGLRNLGPTLRRWRLEWEERRGRNPAPDLSLPLGTMNPAGYVFMQHFARNRRPVKAFDRWMQRIPEEYRTSVLGETQADPVQVDTDPHCLAKLKHYRSLMPMAMEARKPMFLLKPADGAIGAHVYAVQDCRKEFAQLAHKIAQVAGFAIPEMGEALWPMTTEAVEAI